MRVITSDLYLCLDCTVVAVNGDTSGIDSDERLANIQAGLDRLGPHLCADSTEDSGREEYSTRVCDCCRTQLDGSRERFAILGEGSCEELGHEADPTSLTNNPANGLLVDVGCKHCGTTGSVQINPADLQW